MALGSAAQRSAIEAALLDYHRTPGKYARTGKQPAVLFTSITPVLQLASGRAPNGDAAEAPSTAVQKAACFFIRTVLLYPDADHYALLGLEREASATAAKERYRLMMRLMHPDFSGSLTQADWPADAATRVNQAYEVLSSPAQRRSYDERLDAPVPRQAVAAPTVRAMAALKAGQQARAASQDPRRGLKWLAAFFGVAGALALIALAFTGGAQDKETLVQRLQANPARAPAAVLQPASLAAAGAPLATAPEPKTEPVAIAPSTPPPAPAPVRVALLAPAERASPQVPPSPRAPPPIQVSAQVGVASVPPASVPPTALPAPPITSIAPVLPLPPAVPVAPPAAVTVATVAPPAATAKAPTPSLTLAEVHPLLARLLQQMESGWGDQVLNLLERDARGTPGAQALLLHYNSLVDGMRPVKLGQVQFKGEPREDRLLVTGHVFIQAANEAVPARKLAVQAEFVSRGGTVVMTRLARAQD